MRKKITFLLMVYIAALFGMPSSIAAQTDEQIFRTAYTAPKDSIKLSPIQNFHGRGTKPMLYAIERRANDTKVTLSAPVYFDRQWFSYGWGLTIIDKLSGDEYKVRGYDGGAPYGRVMFVEGFNNKCILISFLFPKLKRSVKNIDILALPHETDLTPSNNDGIPAEYLNIKVKDYLSAPKKSRKIYR